jgi:selenocysteine lyase/cysteine desulfurase
MQHEVLTARGARAEFDRTVTYLNTATYGLPPSRSWVELDSAQTAYRTGRVNPQSYDESVERARAAFARLVEVDPAQVAVGSQVSAFVGLVAASLPSGSEVLTAIGDFTSLRFPFQVQQARGVSVREASLDQIAGAVTERTTLVAVSAVQSADGRLLDLTRLREACHGTGTRILLDITQAAGWRPVDAGSVDYTVCSGYKWLLAPRGTAYFTVQPELMDGLLPHQAGWYAGDHPWQTFYGGPLRLAADARRFDLSPAWHSWVAAAPALEMLAAIGALELRAHSVGLANRFRAGLGLESGDSAIMSLAVDEEAPEAMRAADIVAASRAGRLRVSFHLANDEADIAHALTVIGPHVIMD